MFLIGIVGLAVVSCIEKKKVAINNDKSELFKVSENEPVIIYQTDKYKIYQKEIETYNYHGFVIWGEDKEGNLVTVAKH